MGFIRYILAFAVVIAHFNYAQGTDYYFPLSSYHAVGGFFALSGFLIYHSYLTSRNFKNFICKRFRKIAPPYYFIIFSCAFFLFFTIDPSHRTDYFSIDWIKYIISNICYLNFIHPSIPYVFNNTPINVSLWTIKIEWLLYFSIPIVIFISYKLKLTKKNEFYLYLFIYLVSALYRIVFYNLYISTEKEIYNILSRQFLGQLCFFYSGVIFYRYLNYFSKFCWPLIIGSIILIFFSDFIPLYNFLIEPLLISLITVGCSIKIKNLSIFNSNNISYEIYLFHYPIIKIVSQYQDLYNLSDLQSLIVSIIAIFGLSFACWFVLDKPILHLNKKL